MHRFIKPLYLLLIIFIGAVGLFTYQVLPTSQQPAANAATLNPVQKENLLPGTPDWQITHPAPSDAKNDTNDQGIEGYASKTSTQSGETISFAVNTTSPSFTADIYRLGWYQGNGGRFMQSIPNIAGHSYPVPSPDPTTGLIEANWPIAFSVHIPRTWVSGMYLVKLTDANGEQSYIPFTVRAISTLVTDLVFVHSANTDEAYNQWGGTSLYADMYGTLPQGRAVKVSFDRPSFGGYGSGFLLEWEYPMIRWLEKNGYSVSYLSDVDVDRSSTVLMGHKGILIVGHSEYWSYQMRAHLETAVASGTSLGVFGANTMYWQIRYAASSTAMPNRIIICYRDAALDPSAQLHPSTATVRWRDTPLNRPEQSLLGSMYTTNFAEAGSQPGFAWLISNPSSWVFANTSLQYGSTLQGLVGYEVDALQPNYAQPATIVGADGSSGVEVLSNSLVTNDAGNQIYSNSTLYTASSGARVFNAGTIQWSWGVDDFSLSPDPRYCTYWQTQQITANLLHNFITGAITPGTMVN